MKNNWFTKGIAFLLVSIILVGCGDKGKTPESTEPVTPENVVGTEKEENKDNTAKEPATTLSSEHKYGGSLVVATKLEPSNYVVNYAWNGAIVYISRNILSRLVAVNDYSGELYGDLAETWESSEDLKTFTFNLRKGVLWHDGEPFTAADVKWTIDSILEMGESAYTYKLIRMIESVETPDDYTVVINLSEPNGIMINNIADYSGFDILPKHLYEETDVVNNPYNLKPIGTGPFKFVEHVIGSHTRLEANPDYYGAGPYLDEVIYMFTPSETTAMTAIEAKEAGWMTASPAFAEVGRLEKVEHIQVDMQPSSITQYTGFNMDGSRNEISDPVVRKAIAHAINNDDIVDKLYMGLVNPATSYYTTVVEWADNKDARLPVYDPELANQMLDDAGYEKNAKGVRFGIVYRCFPTSIFGTTDIPVLVSQYLAAIGIEVKIEQYEWALRNEMLDNQRDWDMFSGGGDRGPDGANFANFVASSSSANKMHYKNETIDALFDDATLLGTKEERAPFYFEVQDILATDSPIYNYVEYAVPRVYSNEYYNFPWNADVGNAANHMVNTVEWINGEAR